jgi:hypothetical protein
MSKFLVILIVILQLLIAQKQKRHGRSLQASKRQKGFLKFMVQGSFLHHQGLQDKIQRGVHFPARISPIRLAIASSREP